MPRILRILNRFNLGGPTYNAAYLSKYMPSEFETLLIGGQKAESEASSLHITEDLGLNPIVIPTMLRELNPKKRLRILPENKRNNCRFQTRYCSYSRF